MSNAMDESRAEYDDVCAQKVETKKDENIVIPPKIPVKESDKKQEDLKSAASTLTSTSTLMLFSLLFLIMNY